MSYNIRFRLLAPLVAVYFCACSCNNAQNNENPQKFTVGSEKDSVHAMDGLDKTAAGQKIYQARCIMCHGLYGNARQENAANLQLSRLDSLGIVTTIKYGRNNMPMFGLSDSELAQVEIYVKTLRTP